MKEIWELLKEKEKDIRFQQTEYFSPYYEVGADGITKKENGKMQVEFNSFYRYEQVFADFFDTEMTKTQRTLLYDCVLHYLIHQEFLLGITRQEQCIREYWKQLEQGGYGQRIREIFCSFTKEEKHLIARSLYQQSLQKESCMLFARITAQLLSDCVVYTNRLCPQEILVYIEHEPDAYMQEQLFMMEELFLPLSYTCRVFWNKHFGVVKEQQTMELGEIEIF